MKPLDPRLLRHARRAVVPIAVLAALGLASAALVIAQAWLLATMIANVFIDKATLAACTVPLAALAAITVGRAAVGWAAQAAAHRASAEAKMELRSALLARVLALGPDWRRASGDSGNGGRRDAAALTQLATTGLDGLDGYFTSYLPALIGAVAVPVAVLITITVADPVSGITVACTLPLVPLFGALIGRATGRRAAQRWRALATLAHHFHDVVSGLPTLRVFGRAHAQRGQIAQITNSYRLAIMATLRLAFLSSLALELVATMSVALVATEIGLRLAYGHLDLRTGLLVLICAPEAYLPLRALGTQFHATADGLAAAEEVFAILETPRRRRRKSPSPSPARLASSRPLRPSHHRPARPLPALPGRPPLHSRRRGQRPPRGPRRPRPGPRHLHHRTRPPHRPHRPERLRQNHAAQLPPRLQHADIGIDKVKGPDPERSRGSIRCPARRAAPAERVRLATAGPDAVHRHGRREHPPRLARRPGRGRGHRRQGRRPR